MKAQVCGPPNASHNGRTGYSARIAMPMINYDHRRDPGPLWGTAGAVCAWRVKGTETLDSASRDQFVLMDEAAQDVRSR